MAHPRYAITRAGGTGHERALIAGPGGSAAAGRVSPATAVLDLERPGAAVQPLALMPHPLDGWETRAACRWVVTGPDTDVFYGPDGEPNPKTVARQRAAKAICARCPVRPHCLEFALDTREPYGIWGGLTASERRGLLATRGIRLPKHHHRQAVGSGW